MGETMKARYRPETFQRKVAYLIEECGELTQVAGKRLAYYYDTDETEALDVINECDLITPPAQCISGDVDHTSNVIDAGMVAPYFDLDSGLLLPAYQALAVDLGPLGTGVTADIDGTARDALPDIGATEY